MERKVKYSSSEEKASIFQGLLNVNVTPRRRRRGQGTSLRLGSAITKVSLLTLINKRARRTVLHYKISKIYNISLMSIVIRFGMSLCMCVCVGVGRAIEEGIERGRMNHILDDYGKESWII
ncbi:hypothetical protein V1478_018424 [Vespula squamosa]|uniref:Transmembrane protein n=1 Tax=Vespula squamosa TaxID=30214 RepID=A0ABD1ZV02_VESSQ